MGYIGAGELFSLWSLPPGMEGEGPAGQGWGAIICVTVNAGLLRLMLLPGSSCK